MIPISRRNPMTVLTVSIQLISLASRDSMG